MAQRDVGRVETSGPLRRRDKGGQPLPRPAVIPSHFCIHHTVGEERDRVDEVRLARACKAALSNNEVDRERALKTIRNIQRRMLHRAWLRDPTVEGSTLELSPYEQERMRFFLRNDLGLDIDRPDPVTGQLLTPRATDRARWATYLCLSDRCTREAARRRVAGLLRDERRYWSRQSAR
jgi:hypothetical protein